MMISREGERGANGKREHHLGVNLVGAAARKRQVVDGNWLCDGVMRELEDQGAGEGTSGRRE